MRVKLFNRVGVAALILSVLVSCFPTNVSEASKINFSQSILPVKFAYVDSAGQVQKIWSNVGEKDSQYVLKFFQLRSNREIGLSQATLESFRQKEKIMAVDNKTTLVVDFASRDGIIEEIRTVV